MIVMSKTAATLLLSLAGSASMLRVHGFVVKEPPMPFKWPIVGTLPDFFARGGVGRLRQIYEEMYSEFGNVYGMSPMGKDQLIVCDPYVFDTVLRKEGKYPIGGSEEATTFADYYKETNNTMGIKSISRGPEWKEWRKALEPDMYVAWASYLPMIADTASKISKVAGYEVTERKNVAFIDFISRSAFDMFTAVMYGESPQTTDSRVADPTDIEFVQASQTAFDLTGELIANPLAKVFGTDTYQSFKVNMDKVFNLGWEVAEEYVAQVQQKPKVKVKEEDAGKCPVTAVKNKMPFVERLLNRGEMSTNDIKSISGPMQMAGVDTTVSDIWTSLSGSYSSESSCLACSSNTSRYKPFFYTPTLSQQ
mmetsp:Transcript_27082/g.49898  ORF Transcript_27082/g.49898 Transcript_27082/m.49898 type:complete len:364 (+) Transcript_27082:153-1244(+)